jgi:hypothetical protein
MSAEAYQNAANPFRAFSERFDWTRFKNIPRHIAALVHDVRQHNPLGMRVVREYDRAVYHHYDESVIKEVLDLLKNGLEKAHFSNELNTFYGKRDLTWDACVNMANSERQDDEKIKVPLNMTGWALKIDTRAFENRRPEDQGKVVDPQYFFVSVRMPAKGAHNLGAVKIITGIKNPGNVEEAYRVREMTLVDLVRTPSPFEFTWRKFAANRVRKHIPGFRADAMEILKRHYKPETPYVSEKKPTRQGTRRTVKEDIRHAA